MLLAASAVMELLTIWWLHGGLQKIAASITLVVASFAAGGLLALHVNLLTCGVLVAGLYRVVNLLRIIETRMQADYLRRATRTTACWLLGVQAVMLIGWLGLDHSPVVATTWLMLLLSLQLLVAAMPLMSTVRHLRTTRVPKNVKGFSDQSLPTVTVAVPARNEDEQLEACLRSILTSDYPKLEVLVLDDGSQDHTPQIIRDFAHDGVRFIPGDEPKSKWLAKNQAYARLSGESSGEVLLFCGVDVRFEQHTVRELVEALIRKRKSMISVMPVYSRRGLSLLQSMRYMWELAPPRRMFNRPPVLSTCWLITRVELDHAGGFAAVARSVTPEAYFAKHAILGDGYSFMHADARSGLISVKDPDEQRNTAIRTRYPQMHRRPELVMLLSLFELGFIVAPFVLVLVGATGIFGWLAEVVLLGSVLAFMVSYRAVCGIAFAQRKDAPTLLFPIAVAADIVILNYSMWAYEFSEVIWKGRNVSVPVMRAYPRLPEF